MPPSETRLRWRERCSGREHPDERCPMTQPAINCVCWGTGTEPDHPLMRPITDDERLRHEGWRLNIRFDLDYWRRILGDHRAK